MPINSGFDAIQRPAYTPPAKHAQPARRDFFRVLTWTRRST